MRQLNLQNIPVGARLFLTLIIMFLSFSVIMFVGALLGTMFFEDSLGQIMGMADFTDRGNLALLKYLQIVQSIGLFVVPPFIAALLFGTTVASYLKFKKKPYTTTVLMVVFLTIVATPFINYLAELNANLNLPASMDRVENWMKQMEKTATELTEILLKADTFNVFLLNLFMIAIIPAVGEELLFRGVIQKQLALLFKNTHAGIWLAAILFSALHLQFYGFIPRMFLGVLFGYLLVWTGSIWIPMIAHFINNAAAVFFYYLYSKQMVNEDLDTIGAAQTDFYYVIISFVGIVLLSFGIYRYEKRRLND
jgi:hypothetical protein